MKVAVLAVQGAFIEHEKALERLGVETVELRKAEDLEQDFDGLVLPGGESTVQSRLLKELSMFEPLKKKIEEGLPVLATCAGLILLAQNISNDENRCFATLPVTVKRNAYGRQLGSFYYEERLKESEHFLWNLSALRILNLSKKCGNPCTSRGKNCGSCLQKSVSILISSGINWK